MCVDRDRPAIDERRRGARPRPRPDKLAYVIHTRGPPGKPKGVQVSHRAVINFLAAMRNPGLERRRRLLAVTTLSFDIAGLRALAAAERRRAVGIAPREATMDGVRLPMACSPGDGHAGDADDMAAAHRCRWQGSDASRSLCSGEALAAR